MRNKVNILPRKRFVFPFLLLAASLVSCSAQKDALLPDEAFLRTEEASPEESGREAEPQPSVCYVHVCGAVEREGVYELPEGARVFEAIAAAGGLLEDADASAVNQAQCVTDGSRLDAAMAKALKSKAPTLVEVVVDKEAEA